MLHTVLCTGCQHGIRAVILLLLALGMGLGSGGCQESGPKKRASAQAVVLPVVAAGRGLLFSFFSPAGDLRTVERLDKIESTARASVRVIDPKRALDGDRVFVADLRETSLKTGFKVWVEPKAQWLQRTMPKSSALRRPLKLAAASPARAAPSRESIRQKGSVAVRRSGHSPKKRAKHRRRAVSRASTRAPVPATSDGGSTTPTMAWVPPAPVAAPKRAAVLLFSTRWCGSCRAARAFFRKRGVSFVEMDIETDARAAAQYARICSAKGLRPGAVPLIVVGKAVFMGFSKFRIQIALNQLPQGT